MARECTSEGCRHPARYLTRYLGDKRSARYVCEYHVRVLVDEMIDDPNGIDPGSAAITVWGRI